MSQLSHITDNINMMDNFNNTVGNWSNMMSGMSCFPGNFNSPIGILISIFWLLFWISIILILVFVLIYLFKKINSENFEKTAVDILEKRYAKGEISKEEFERKKQDLERK